MRIHRLFINKLPQIITVVFQEQLLIKIDFSCASTKPFSSHRNKEIVPFELAKEFMLMEGDDSAVVNRRTKDIYAVSTCSKYLEVRMLIYTEVF